MGKLWVPMFLLAIAVAGCSSKDDTKKNEESIINFTRYSESVKDTFYISIQLPAEYFKSGEKKFRTAVLVDGNFYFPMMASIASQYETAGLLEPIILVGVGYKSFKSMDSLRVRDYLYPKALPSDEMEAIGGGQNFYTFLTKELLPEIDSRYRTDGNRKSLLGHSFGGYFVLYSLLNQLQNKTNDFDTFISASPSLWYNNFYLNQLPEQLAQHEGRMGIFLSVGGLEDSTWSVKPLKDFTAEIQKRNIKDLQIRTRIYNDLDHMDVAVLSFTKGLQELTLDKNK